MTGVETALLISAIVGAMGTAANTYMAARKGGPYAPEAGGGKAREPFSVPNMFGNNSLLGNENRPRLSQALAGEETVSPQYGPQQMSPFEMYAMQQQGRGMTKGK